MTVIDYAEIVAALRAVPGVAEADVEPDAEGEGLGLLREGRTEFEAMCKATTRRIKGPGMRWDSDNAEALMALEALHQSNLWEKYWTRALTHSN